MAQDHEMNAIYNQFVELRKKQEELASDYEEKSSNGMAYISRWYVLEKILKILHTRIKADEIHNKVRKWWEEYLSNPDSNQAEPLKSLNLKEELRIPRVEDIEKHLDCELPVIKEIMNTKSGNGSTKWRDKRSDIAHRALPFGRDETYEEYRNKIIEGISEIEQALNDKCN